MSTEREYQRPQFPVKTKPGKSIALYRAWSAKRIRCYACHGDGGWRGLHTHHIIKRGRAHEPCNLTRLCARCHDLAENHDVRGDAEYVKMDSGRWERRPGELLPKLTIGMCLTLKIEHDPDEYDAERLEVLRGSRLPDPEPVPAFFLAERRKRGAA